MVCLRLRTAKMVFREQSQFLEPLSLSIAPLHDELLHYYSTSVLVTGYTGSSKGWLKWANVGDVTLNGKCQSSRLRPGGGYELKGIPGGHLTVYKNDYNGRIDSLKNLFS